MAFPKLLQNQNSQPLDGDGFAQLSEQIGSSISAATVLSEERLKLILLGLVCQGHVLLEDAPGVGKTLLAKSLAQSIDGRFARVQCTPDLLPSDITGTSVYNLHQSSFEFKPGPVFSNVLVADEINRTGPRTQSALLEAMAEQQVSADGRIYKLPSPFMVIATQNRYESHGVFPLPDSQYDRFLIRMSVGMPSFEQELEILGRAEHGQTLPDPVASTLDVTRMQDFVSSVEVSVEVKRYLIAIAQSSRSHPSVSAGVSPRGTVLLQRASQGWAALDGRSEVDVTDVSTIGPYVLGHRMGIKGTSGLGAEPIVEEILESASSNAEKV